MVPQGSTDSAKTASSLGSKEGDHPMGVTLTGLEEPFEQKLNILIESRLQALERAVADLKAEIKDLKAEKKEMQQKLDRYEARFGPL
ncbi:hypothetical protein JCM10207_000254 [Rhodosporidiobolus poonsookiae]